MEKVTGVLMTNEGNFEMKLSSFLATESRIPFWITNLPSQLKVILLNPESENINIPVSKLMKAKVTGKCFLCFEDIPFTFEHLAMLNEKIEKKYVDELLKVDDIKKKIIDDIRSLNKDNLGDKKLKKLTDTMSVLHKNFFDIDIKDCKIFVNSLKNIFMAMPENDLTEKIKNVFVRFDKSIKDFDNAVNFLN